MGVTSHFAPSCSHGRSTDLSASKAFAYFFFFFLHFILSNLASRLFWDSHPTKQTRAPGDSSTKPWGWKRAQVDRWKIARMEYDPESISGTWTMSRSVCVLLFWEMGKYRQQYQAKGRGNLVEAESMIIAPVLPAGTCHVSVPY